MMKRYAAHRIYISPTQVVGRSVITLNEKGEAVAYEPFAAEVPYTQWIGGVIFLSSQEKLTGEEIIRLFFTEKQEDGDETQSSLPLYAWHVSDFDFKMDQLPAGKQPVRLT